MKTANSHSPTRSRSWLIFALVFAFGLSWALYTRHAWEDYYITYRAAKNLATGHGLTFTAGEQHVHSFTSPLGVLLPALASKLTGNTSDDAALWIFRVISLAAYGGAAVLLWHLFRILFGAGKGAVVIVLLFAIDTKIVDYSTNGQETAFMMLFMGWNLYALLAVRSRQAVHLGLAWAGLMWTRPDSCVYIAASALSTLLFGPFGESAGSRWRFLGKCIVGGLITTGLYLPWTIWTWTYYGTVIPNTITAKGLFHDQITAAGFLKLIADFPKAVTAHVDMLATTFMPPYSGNTGWPVPFLKTTYWIALGTMFVWILPRVRREIRVASLVFCIGEFYLTSFVGFPVPWYVPTLTLLSLFVLAGLIAQIWSAVIAHRDAVHPPAWTTWLGRGAWIAAAFLVLGSLTITLLAADQLRLQQKLIERGERQVIGEWLRANAKSEHDTVFLEPLGYIGFYSNLKMYDFPGLSSPEVIAARKRIDLRNYPECWPQLILYLAPDWIVLRDYEADAIRQKNPSVLSKYYSLAKIFDVRPQINAIGFIMGRGYLLNDAYFEVYRRKSMPERDDGRRVGRVISVTAAMMEKNRIWAGKAYDSGSNIVANAPSYLAITKPVGARWLVGNFGIFDGAFKDRANSTDGADFWIYVSTGTPATRRLLFHRFLNPRDVATDRVLQPFSLELPAQSTGTIEFEITPGPKGNEAYDWTYWSGLAFEFPRPN